MHGGEQKNEGCDSDDFVRKEKRKFAGDNVLGEVVGKKVEKRRRYGHLYLCLTGIDTRRKSE